MKEKDKEQLATQTKSTDWVSSALMICIVLVVLFLQHIFVLAQDVKQSNMLGSPNSFVAWPSTMLAICILCC